MHKLKVIFPSRKEKRSHGAGQDVEGDNQVTNVVSTTETEAERRAAERDENVHEDASSNINPDLAASCTTPELWTISDAAPEDALDVVQDSHG